jgi:hypothetical protein
MVIEWWLRVTQGVKNTDIQAIQNQDEGKGPRRKRWKILSGLHKNN